LKDYITYAGGAISLLNLLWFAKLIWQRKTSPQSSASWLMWVILDAVLLGSTIAAKQPMWLPLSYTLGAAAVTVTLFARGVWLWSWKETVCGVGALIAAYLWLNTGALAGIIAGLVAMTFAGMPIMIDMIKTPVRSTLPVWGWTVVACICTIIGSDWTWEGTLVAAGGLSYNGIMSVLVLRGK